MYQDLSVQEKIELLKDLEGQGFTYVFTPVNGKPYGLTEEQYVEMKRREWEENKEEYQSDDEMTFEEWLENDTDELVLGIDHELCSLEC